MSAPDRAALLDRVHPQLSVRRQCRLLSVARSGVYRPKPAVNDDADQALIRRLDELFTAHPFFGSRKMTTQLRAWGHRVNRIRVQRLMRLMGIAALGPKPRTSKPATRHTSHIRLPDQLDQKGCQRKQFCSPACHRTRACLRESSAHLSGSGFVRSAMWRGSGHGGGY